MRLYWESVKKWIKENKKYLGGAGTLAVATFLFLSLSGSISITGIAGSEQCAGTHDDSCYAYINFTANEDVFLYKTDYDPWGRNISLVNFSNKLKDWKIQRSWGDGWRDINLKEGCTGSWCGCDWCRANNTAEFSYAFRENRSYEIRIVAYKENSSDDVKWNLFNTYGTSGEETNGVWKGIGFNALDYKAHDEPKVTLYKWGREVALNVSLVGGKYNLNGMNKGKSGNKHIYDYRDFEANAYPLPNITKDGGFEFDFVINEKNANKYRKIKYDLEGIEDLEFYYQEPLDEEMNNESCNATHCEGSYRPENVVGSYAVYHKSKKDNEYKTGKLFHIYRPLIIDANNDTVYGNLSYKNGQLTVTTPKDFLNNAEYPVRVDPTFGYDTSGGSSAGMNDRIAGSWFTAPEGATVTNISAYIDTSHVCFTGDTNVTMADGSRKKIKNIEVGDKVLSYNQKSEEFVKDTVTETFHHSPEEMGDYYLQVKAGNNTVEVTPNHPVYVEGKFVSAGELELNDTLMNKEGEEIKIKSIEKVYEKVPTYNLHIEENHVYFSESFLAHNRKPRSIDSDAEILIENNNYKELKKFKTGDEITTYNTETEEKEIGKVQDVTPIATKDTLIINEELELTPSHKVYTSDGWKEAQDLEIGEEVIKKEGWVNVTLIERGGTQEVLSLSTTPNSNFFASGFLVHNHDGYAKTAIYRRSDDSLVGQTEELTLSEDDSKTEDWRTFNISSSDGITKDVDYYLASWGNIGELDDLQVYYDSSTEKGGYQNQTYNSWPNPWSPTSEDRKYSIYATYETNPPNQPTLNNPPDNSTGISTSPTLNVTVTDDDGDIMNVSFYDASDDSLIGQDTNVDNGSDATYEWSGLDEVTTYDWYAVADDGSNTTTSDTWNFTTGEPKISLERLYPLTNLDISQNEFFNITLNVSCLNDNCGDINVSFDPTSDYNKFKELNVTSATGTPSTEGIIPLKITSGDDSTTGTGDIVLDWTNINSKEDIAVYDENDTLLDYYFESFDASNEEAVIHVYRDWVRDGSKQAQIAYGDGPSDQSSSASTVFDKEKDNSNLVSGWLLNETSGDALDVTSNNNDGTVNGATQGVDGQVDGAYDFDGDDDYVEVADDDSLDMGTKDFTVGAWVNLDEDGYGRIISKDSLDEDDWFFHVNADKDFRPGINVGGNVENLAGSENSVTHNEWVFLVWTLDRDGNQVSYVDGEKEYSSDISSYSDDSITNEKNVYIGAREEEDDLYFGGSIDEVQIYDRALNPTEIEAKYDASKSSPTFFSQEESKEVETKGGLISTTEGDTPFYTNLSSNPYTINLDEGESQEVTAWVNATGEIDTTHTFFEYANLTSDMSISDKTSDYNVIIQEPNYAPNVQLNNPNDGETGVSTSPTLNVTVTDDNGDNMNVSFYDASDDSLIGQKTNIADGSEATYEWSGLDEVTTYDWYAVADDGSNTTTSDTWNFTTEEPGSSDINYGLNSNITFRFPCDVDTGTTNSTPEGQTSSDASLWCKNNGTLSGDFQARLESEQSEDWNMSIANASKTELDLNTTWKTFYSNVSSGTNVTNCAWFYADCAAGTDTHPSSIDLRAVSS